LENGAEGIPFQRSADVENSANGVRLELELGYPQ
jgi:hypothetical protein